MARQNIQDCYNIKLKTKRKYKIIASHFKLSQNICSVDPTKNPENRHFAKQNTIKCIHVCLDEALHKRESISQPLDETPG